MAPADIIRNTIRSIQNVSSRRSGKKRRIVMYLLIALTGRNSAGATKNAATQINADACMPCGTRSLCRNPSNVALAIVRTWSLVRDGVNDFSSNRVHVGREDQGPERVLE